MFDFISNANNCHSCKVAKCSLNCPLHMDIPLVCDLIKENELKKASEVLFNYNPFGYVTGLLCDFDKQCCGNCVFHSVNFNEIEFELSKKYFNDLINYPLISDKSDIAIIGGGIAGLTVAHYLLKMGVKSTIYEKNKLGGIIENYIPSFRFNNEYFKMHIERIKSLIDVKKEEICEENINVLKKYKHIVFANGASIQNKSLDSEYLISGVDILADYKNNNCKIKDKKVCVIGLGNTACDVARSLKRLNNDVTIIYRRDLSSSPASLKEINELKKEEIKFEFLLSIFDIFKNNDKIIVKAYVNELINNDLKKKKDIKATSQTKEFDFDYAIDATGSRVDESLLKLYDFNAYQKYLEFKHNNSDEKYYYSNEFSVCGDAYYGAWNIAHAINSAHSIVKKIKPTYLFGGSFNPVTTTHTKIIENLSKRGKVIIVPNCDNYYLKNLASFDKRVEMLKIVTKNNSNVEISYFEQERTYKGSVETLRYYNHPIMVIGDDCLNTISTWLDAKRLVEENNFIVFSRNYSVLEIKDLIKNDLFLSKYESHFIVEDILEQSEKNVSSSDYRNNKNVNVVNKEICKYIKNNKLYEV